MSGERKARRVAVFGLDGADFSLLRPWLEDGALPCLSRLYRHGASGALASTIPPLSPEAWASFATGQNPGKHGIVNFVQPKPGSYELQFSCGGLRRGRSLWQLLSQAGVSVGVVNVPMTYPPEAVNGFLVSGPDAPGVQADFTYPRDLKEKLLGAVGKYDIHGDYWGRTTPDDYLRRLVATVENQQRAWRYLLSTYEPEVFVGVFGSTDRAQHFLWKYADSAHPAHEIDRRLADADPLATVYAAVDDAIADCLSLMGDDVTVIIMSDHGAGPCHKTVYLDRWLQSQGLLSYRKDGEAWHKGLLHRTYGLARKTLPRWAKDWLKTRWQGVRQDIESSIVRDPIDWANTRAFFLGTESAYIYLNSQDRFPQGVVRPGAEADALCDTIAQGLSRILDPDTGRPVVEAVYRRDEVYRGPRDQVALLPDLVVLWRDSEYVVRRARNEGKAAPDVIVESGIKVGEAARFMSLELSACHRPDGILIVAGPGVPAGAPISDANIIDLAPTILSLLGISPPSDMDGRALPELPLTLSGAPAPTTANGREPAPGESEAIYGEAEREEIERRLRGLGYLD